MGDGPALTALGFELPAPHVALVTLRRAEVANALSRQLFDELDGVLDRIERDDDIRVWILTGAPRPDGRPWFSAGADMKEAGTRQGRVDPAKVVDRIDEMLKPSIAAIAGTCTTGALEVVLACDLRIAATDARLSDWHLKRTGLGIGAWGAAARLSRLIGVDRAKEFILLGQEISGTRAAEIGLVHRAVPVEDLLAEALTMATTIAGMARRGVRTTLGYLELQADMAKREAIRWGPATPGYMGLELRPFTDAAGRFFREKGDPGER
ncbi:MAG: enoyl-CoA hydratase-related protein [Ilumatobacteraceae bacterium]